MLISVTNILIDLQNINLIVNLEFLAFLNV
jgi:hypothetical protein